MKLKFKLGVAAVIAAIFMPLTTVSAARTDMVDVSNHNGQMYTSDFLGMRNTYGIKAMVTKISEGLGYADWTAAGNIAAAKRLVSMSMAITLPATIAWPVRLMRLTTLPLLLKMLGCPLVQC